MTPWPDLGLAPVEGLGRSSAVYGLAPGPAGHRLADVRCTPDRDGWRGDWVYGSNAVAVVLSGVFEYASEGRMAAAVPGAMVFANKAEAFTCRHLSSDANRRLVVFLGEDIMEGVAEDLALDAARFPAPAAPPSVATQSVSGLMLRLALGHEDGHECAAALTLAGMRPHGAVASDRISAPDERRIIDVVRHINVHFAGPCALEQLAAIAGMSRFRFARRFREVTGETAAQYVLNRRLSAAAIRLAATRRPVADIAYEAGFNDLSYFYARFRIAFGQPPGAWRRLMR